jgi:hypothetical protein
MSTSEEDSDASGIEERYELRCGQNYEGWQSDEVVYDHASPIDEDVPEDDAVVYDHASPIDKDVPEDNAVVYDHASLIDEDVPKDDAVVDDRASPIDEDVPEVDAVVYDHASPVNNWEEYSVTAEEAGITECENDIQRACKFLFYYLLID